VATVRYTSGFHEIVFHPQGLEQHWVDATWFFDAQATYELTTTKPVESRAVAGYSKDSKDENIEPRQTANYSIPSWKNLLNHVGYDWLQQCLWTGRLAPLLLHSGIQRHLRCHRALRFVGLKKF
jgi:hypothetical protein